MTEPSTVSWGGNNRTVALRVIAPETSKSQTRIEHRVASAAANIYCVVNAILESALEGIKREQYPKIKRVYGNAFDAQYEHSEISKGGPCMDLL